MERTAKRQRSAINVDGDDRLFVAAERMFEVKAAMEPAEILKRAKLPPEKWDRWRNKHGKDHWILKWCYGDDPPAGVRLVMPFERRPKAGRSSPRLGELPPGAFSVDEGMPQFRKVAKPRSAEKWAARTNRTGKDRLSIFHWLNAYENQGWFERWLIHREELPHDLRAVPQHDVRHCWAGWNRSSIAESSDGATVDIYRTWFERFPVDGLPAWANWLFGGPVPAGWYVIDNSELRLKQELGPAAVCAASGVAFNSYTKWRDDPLQFSALQELIASTARDRNDGTAVNRLREKYPVNGRGPNSESFEMMIAAMRRYAKHATWTSAFLRVANGDDEQAKLLQYRWHKQLQRAARSVGGESCAQALREFVAEPVRRDDTFGVVDERGLFLPLESMLRFRHAAKALRPNHRLSAYPAGCVRLWFLDWTLPREYRERYLIEDGPVIRSADAKPKPDDPINGEPLNEIQREIMQALDGQALLANALQRQLDVGRHKLFDDGLTPLREAGRIDRDLKMGGYYRPDSPPKL